MPLQTSQRINFKSSPISSYEEHKCTDRMSRRKASGRYVGEDLGPQKRFCNTSHFRSPVLLTTLAEVSPAGFEDLLARERKLAGMKKVLVLNTHGEFS